MSKLGEIENGQRSEGKVRPDNGTFLRHRFSPKPTSVATPTSLPKRNHVAKKAVSAALQTKTCPRSDRHGKPKDAPKTKPRPSVKTMLWDAMNCQFLLHFESAASIRACRQSKSTPGKSWKMMSAALHVMRTVLGESKSILRSCLSS